MQSSKVDICGGFSIFEVLVVLSVASMLITLALAADLKPSVRLQLQKQAYELHQLAAKRKAVAIRDQQTQVLHLESAECSDGPIQIYFYVDGTSSSGRACIKIGEHRASMKMDPITGQFLKLEHQ